MSKPEDRYVELTTKILKNGKVVYASARPKTVTTQEDSDYHIVANERTRMDIIANNLYGSPADWWRVAAANKRVDGSLHISPNTSLIIPKSI